MNEYRVSDKSDKKNIQQYDILLLIFGGGPQEIYLKNSFEDSFWFEKNIKIWADIGVNPFDRNWILDDKVKHEIVVTEDGAIDIDADPLSTKLLQIENQNKRATELLQLNGYNRSALMKLAPRLDLCKIKTCVTDPNSREIQYLLG